MVDVQLPQSSLPRSLTNQSQIFDLSQPSRHGINEQSLKRGHTGQNIHYGSEASPYKPSSPSTPPVKTSEILRGLGLYQSDMSITGFPGQKSQYSASQTPSRPASDQRQDSTYSSGHPATQALQKPASPEFLPAEDPSGKNSGAIASYLQLPHTITESKGSLAEFAAQVTCLFWFESSSTLSQIESCDLSPLPFVRLVPEAYPATGFLKWVTTILSTTQVTQNVILMALLFIYRLKKQNPSVKGKLGSEYRLLTVALMLGNKFLDDNTYTNKTWAEVSGISVHEIHVMEVEFLSHMKYNLYTSREGWQQWHQTLSRFFSYFDRLSRQRHEMTLAAVSSRRPSLNPYALPSPPESATASPPYPSALSPHGVFYTGRPVLAPPLAGTMPSQVTASERKRSYEESFQEPQAKRHSTYGLHPSVTVGPYGQAAQYPQAQRPNLPSLPLPNLPAPGHQHQHPYSYMPTPVATSTPNNFGAVPTYLPPVNWHQPTPITTGTPSSQANLFLQTHGLPDPLSRNHTPTSARPTATATSFPSAVAHTLPSNQNSPQYFLQQRSSPYRPVRGISTLLNPPPSSSMNRNPQNISQGDMRWQPIGKNTAEYPGRVPYQFGREAWPQAFQPMGWPASQYPING